MDIFLPMVPVIFIIIALAIAYAYGELEIYRRGGDVWGWTIKLANFIKRFKS